MQLTRVFFKVTPTVTSIFTEIITTFLNIFILRFIVKKLRIRYSPVKQKLNNRSCDHYFRAQTVCLHQKRTG